VIGEDCVVFVDVVNKFTRVRSAERIAMLLNGHGYKINKEKILDILNIKVNSQNQRIQKSCVSGQSATKDDICEEDLCWLKEKVGNCFMPGNKNLSAIFDEFSVYTE
jgi:hypothetical protein